MPTSSGSRMKWRSSAWWRRPKIALKKSGKDLIGTCPFHEDGEPSLVVTPSKNLWHCFGCQSGGDAIAWVMKLRGVSFRHAVELLHADPAFAADAQAAPVKRTSVRSLLGCR
ncbi:CHC2 zinc finger domain-containing protein [Massilia sp. B-10]|nr:CHC2 zinc finger domain-containing protein [Massilia sp. B-10]